MELLSAPACGRLMRRSSLVALLFAAVLSQAGCIAPRAGARQYQDEGSAVTITVATEPLVLAREVSMLAVNARDYISLMPLEVNRSGQRRYYFFGYSWSTIDRRDGAGVAAPGGAELALQADDRTIALRMSAGEFQNAGVGALPVPPPVPGAQPLLFPSDRATLLFVGTAQVLSAQPPASAGAAPVERYRQWTVPDSGFKAFFDRIGPAQPVRTPSR